MTLNEKKIINTLQQLVHFPFGKNILPSLFRHVCIKLEISKQALHVKYNTVDENS